MQNNVLIGVLLSIAFVTPVIAWLFYLWYRSHLTRMHHEGQIFDRRNRDRAQANYEPADGTHNPVMGPYFTPRGWVCPKTRGSSHVLRPPQPEPAEVPPAQSPKVQAGQDEHHNQWGNIEEQHDQTSNHNDGDCWDNRQNTEQNDHNSLWGGDSNNDQGEQRNIPSRSPRRNSQDSQKNHGWGQDNDSPRERISPRDNEHHNDHGNRNLQDGWDNGRHVSPGRASRNEVESRRGWGQSDDDAQQHKHLRNNYCNEDHQDRNSGWGDDDRKSYHKESKGYRYASPERQSRGRSSPNRDWGHDDHGEREKYSRNRSSPWEHAEEHRGGNDTEKKERWQIELEENEKRRRSRSPLGRSSDAGWGKRSGSDWKEKQNW
ncbi:uncharacterized protein N7500_005817 [Penicillium coprophilum]|uniref:uncharacterized protein n=1 Tax=Penicillium coprophilum TaxID=36646 RepID=UPI002391FF17|nr:uncharacterized protein N7500_005817 [Penicillium coprophilum]KAJ5163987.1 hypothetical protein N7500_005817 [Penicillium coprophilum]